MTSHHVHNAILLAAPLFTNAHSYLSMQIAFFTDTVQTKANSIHFAHQSLCSPKNSTLLKAIQYGYLKGCPNLTAKGVSKYLNPSLATGHMKHPRQGIQSTRTRHSCTSAPNLTIANPLIIAHDNNDNDELSHFVP
jgi:hypothetical protein